MTRLQNKQGIDQANLNYKTTMAQKTFDYKVEQNKQQVAAQAVIDAEARQAKSQRSLFDYQQSYANPDINSANPQIAQVAAQKLVADALKFAQENGVPVQRNQSQVITDAQNYAKQNGVSLATALQTTFTDPLNSKPEFIEAMDSIRAGKAPAGKLQVIGQRVDPNTGAVMNVYGTVDKSGKVTEAGNIKDGLEKTYKP